MIGRDLSRTPEIFVRNETNTYQNSKTNDLAVTSGVQYKADISNCAGVKLVWSDVLKEIKEM